MSKTVVGFYRVSMPSARSAKLAYMGFKFERGVKETHIMKLSDEEVKNLTSRGFTVKETEAPKREVETKKVKLKDASEAELDAALVKANLPASGSLEEKVAELRKAGIAFARKVE